MNQQSSTPRLSPFMRAAHQVVQDPFYSHGSPEEHLELVWHTLRGMRLALMALSPDYSNHGSDALALTELVSDCAKFQSALSVGLTART